MSSAADPSVAVLPAAVLAAALRADATRPRLTFYDDAPGATHGERIELSAKVLTNWVSKAGNALQEELDVAPGSRVLLDLPPHWRAVYWALAVWSVGATLVLPEDGTPVQTPGRRPDGTTVDARPGDDLLAGVDLLVSDDLDRVARIAGLPRGSGAPGTTVLVSLPMLARAQPDTPSGVFDEARELATYGDVFDAWEPPAAADLALEAGSSTTYGELVVLRSEWGDRPRVEVAGSLRQALLDTLSAWYADGSVVLVRSPEGSPDDPGQEEARAARRAAEGVTVRLR